MTDNVWIKLIGGNWYVLIGENDQYWFATDLRGDRKTFSKSVWRTTVEFCAI